MGLLAWRTCTATLPRHYMLMARLGKSLTTWPWQSWTYGKMVYSVFHKMTTTTSGAPAIAPAPPSVGTPLRYTLQALPPPFALARARRDHARHHNPLPHTLTCRAHSTWQYKTIEMPSKAFLNLGRPASLLDTTRIPRLMVIPPRSGHVLRVTQKEAPSTLAMRQSPLASKSIWTDLSQAFPSPNVPSQAFPSQAVPFRGFQPEKNKIRNLASCWIWGFPRSSSRWPFLTLMEAPRVLLTGSWRIRRFCIVRSSEWRLVWIDGCEIVWLGVLQLPRPPLNQA